MTGVEQILVTLVKTDATSGNVDKSYRLVCSGGSFGSPVDQTTAGWSVGFNPSSGGMLVENRIPFSALGSGMPGVMRLGFDATTGGSVHSASTTTAGSPVIYPNSPGKRRSVDSGGNPARSFQLDGNGNDWGNINPILNGIAGGGNPAIRMVKIYAFANPSDEYVYFRVDANTGSDAPFAEDDEYSRLPGQNLAVAAPGVLANDGDPNGQPITALPVSPAAHGDVTLNADGSFTYAPADPASSQTDSFQYKATNGSKESNVAKVTIKVSAVANNAPSAHADTQTGSEDAPLNVAAPGVLANDTDPDGDPLTATKLTDPANGTVVVNADGSFTYTPNADFFGTDTFTYEITDGEYSSTATVTITVESVNDAPTVASASFPVDENAANGTVVGTVTFSDVDAADGHTFSITGGNSGNAFAISNSGQITVADGTAINFEVSPSYSLTVTVTDNGVPTMSGSATVTVTVNDMNEAPTAVNDATTVAEDGNVNIVAPGLRANDTDPEGDTLTATKVTDPANGVATVAANGGWTYTPNANFNGTDSFTYQVSDGTNTSNIATVTITVTAVNDTPSFTAGGNVTGDEDTGHTGGWATAISAGPADEAGQTLTFNVTTDDNALFSMQPAISSTGVLTFTPAANAHGIANVTVTLSDNGGGASTSAPQNFVLTIREVNDLPTTTADAATTPEDTQLLITAANLATNDSAGPANESGQTKTVTAVSATSAQGGTLTLVAGTITYTPAANYNGPDNFTYTVTDNGTTAGAADPQSAIGTVNVTVTEVNDAPVATNDATGAIEDTPLVFAASTLTTNDTAGPANESGQTITVTGVSATSAQGGTVTLVAGNITYTPPANYFGADSFTYTITDNGTTNGAAAPLTANATVNVTVAPVNDPSVLTVTGAVTHFEAGSATNLATAVTINDVDDTNIESATIRITGNYAGAQDVLVFSTLGPITGSVVGDTLTLSGSDTLANYMAALLSVQYTNTSDTPSTLPRTITWTVNDGNNDSNAQTTALTVTATNDAPVNTVPGAQVASEDTPLTFSSANGNQISINDVDADADDVQVTLNVTNGTVTVNAAGVGALTSLTGNNSGTVVAVGSVAEINVVLNGMVFNPTPNYTGPAGSIQIVTNDLGNNPSGAESDTDSVSITVTENNDPPTATADAQTTPEDTPLAFAASTLTANDTAGPADETGQTLTVTGVSATSAQGGTVTLVAGTITYTPPSNYNGADSFTYTVTDNGTTNSGSDPKSSDGTVNVTVTAVNDAPVATGDAQTTAEGTPLGFAAASLTTNDSAGPADESGQTLTVTGVSATSAQGGTVTLVAGIVTYTPAADFAGTDTFTYTVTDNGTTNGGADPKSSDGTVTVTVTEVNDAPTATDDAINAVEDTALPFAASTLTTNDSKGPANENGQTLTVTAVSATSAQGGTVTLVSGTITYTPPANYNGADSFTYTVTDNGTTNGASAPLTDDGTVNVTVSEVNDAPTLTVTGAVTHTEGGAATTLATAANISDVDDTNIESATIKITGNYAGAEDVLSFVNTPQITGAFVGDTLTLTGTDTLANYIAALQAVQYTNTSDTPSVLQRTITWTVNDGDINSNTQTTTLDVTATNDAPVNTVASGLSTDEDTPLVINGASISDTDAASDDVQITLNVTGGTVTLDATATGALTSLTGDGTATVTATGTVAEINNVLGGMTFTPTLDSSGTASIQMVTDDLGNNPSGNQTDTDSFNITVNALNDAPVLTVTGAPTFSENGSPVPVASAVNITDVDDANIESATVTISANFQALDVLIFTNTPNITGVFAGSTLTLTGSDTKAAYIAALQSVEFSHGSDAPSQAQRTLTWVVNDGDTNSNTQNTTVDVAASNDAPQNTVPAGLATNEDVPLVINGASISDVDSDPDDVQITLNVTNGTVTLDPTATSGLETLTGDGTASVVATGTVAEINAALSGMTFTPTTEFAGTASIQMVTDDLGNNPSGALQDDDTFNITVNNINDAPVLTVTGAPTFAENGSAVAIASSVNITDIDDANIESATITITNVQTGDVLNFVNTVNITGNFAAGVLTLTGSDTKAAYISALQSITFSNASDNPSITQRAITWVVNDGDINSNTQNTTLDVTATNDAPVNTVAVGVSTNEDTPVVINGASISDADADPDDVQITLNVTSGTVTLDPTATGALTSLTGDATGTVTAEGTVAEINAALSGMTFTPTGNFNGTASIQMVTDDLGNNPSGAITDTDSFNITVNAVNDAPSFTPGANVNINEDHGPYSETGWATNITAGPADENTQGLTMNSTVTGTTGTLTFMTAPSVNVVTGNLTFQANANTCGTATVDVVLTDDAGTVGVPGDDLSSTTHTLTIIVACVNDTPSFTKGPDQTVSEDAGAQTVNPWATGISPGAGETDSLTFNVSNDNNSLFTAGGQPAVSPTGVLTYTPAPNANGTTIVSVTLTDDAGTPGVPGDDITTSPAQTFNITVTAVNDVPSFTVQEPPFIVLGTTGAQTATVATAISTGAANESQTLTFTVTGNSTPGLFQAGPTVASDGTLSWTPAPGVHGTSLVTITLTDDNGTPGVPGDDQTSAGQSFTVVVERGPTVDSTSPVEGTLTVTPGSNIVINFSEAVAVDSGAFTIVCTAGNVTFTATASPAATYTLDPTSNMPGGACTVTVDASKTHDTDTFDPPDGLGANFTLTFTVNTPPTAVDDSNSALGNVTLTVPAAQGVLANDTDPDAGATLTVDLTFGTGNPYTTSAGGSVTFAADGSYTYLSEAGDQNVPADTVTYQVKDQHGGTDTGVLSINLGPRVIYVDDVGVAGDGRDSSPFQSISLAQAGAGQTQALAGDTILVKSGNYTDNVTLKNNQVVLGQGISPSHTITHNSVVFTVLTAGTAPTYTTTTGTAFTLAASNTIRGMAINPAAGTGVLGNAFTAVTINQSTISATGGPALNLTTGAATITLTSTSSTNSPATGVNLIFISGSVDLGTGAITNPTGNAFEASAGTAAITYAGNLSAGGNRAVNIASRGAGSGNVTLSGTITGAANGIGISVNGVTAGTVTFSGAKNLSTGIHNGVRLTTNTGGTIVFSGGALVIATTTGTGFTASGGGTVSVLGASNTINTTGLTAAALELSGVTMAAGNGVTFNSVSAGATTVTGVSLSGLLGTGGVTINGGTNSAVTGLSMTTMGTVPTTINNVTFNNTASISGTNFNSLSVSAVTLTATNTLLLLDSGALNGTFTSMNGTITGNFVPIDMTAVTGNFTVSAGTVTKGSTANVLWRVTNGTATINWNGNLTQNTAADGISITGHATGTITFGATVTATAGDGLEFNNADGTYNFSGAATLSGTAGVHILTGSGGTFTWDADSSVSGTTGNLFDIQDSTPAFTYSGSFSKSNTGVGIFIQDNGGTITFNGSSATETKNINVTGAGQNAVTLDNNDAATITFSGNTLVLTTASGNAFSATNGGTVNVTGTGNTATSVGGAAVNVVGTTIGGSHLTFEKVTATGGASGVILNNTGATGRLIVTGNGGTCTSAANCTGGAIQNSTSHGVSLSNTFHPSFTRLFINNTSGSGVHGNEVTNFTYEFGRIDNSGTGLADEASNIAFNTQLATTENNLDGVVSIINNTLTNAYYHGIDIYNHSGTITSANISNNTITSTTSTTTSKGSGIRLVAFGSASTVGSVSDATLDANIISNFPSGAGIVAQGGNANNAGSPGTYGIAGGGAANRIDLTNNRIAGASAAIKMNTHAIQATVNGKGQGNFLITGNGTALNPLTNIGGNVLSHSSLGATTVTSTISNNIINANHTADFGGPIGISVGSGITAGISGSGSLTTTVDGNTVSNTDGPGIQARSAEGSASMVIKIINNNVAAPLGTGASYGIRVESGGASATDNNVCLEISGNTSAGEGGVAGIGLRKQGTVATTHDFGIEGLSPSPNTLATQVTNHVNSQNPGSAGGSELISAQTGFTSCTAP